MIPSGKKKTILFPFGIAVVFLFCVTLFVPSTTNATSLLGASNYIPDDDPDQTGVTHNVGFVIPSDGHALQASDYIRIDLTNFTNVTAPTSGSGWNGVPTFGVAGNVAYVTGVTAPAGTGIGISGMTATNPSNPSDFDVTIETANDVNGSIVYDSATVTAQENSGISVTTVTVSYNTSAIEFFGFTSPSAFVTIMLNGGVAGTTTANSGGNFHHLISGLEQNVNYSVSIYAQDTLLRQTQTVSFVVHTLPYTTHIISNIVLPTTIEINKTVISPGERMDIFGRAKPQSEITVFVGAGSPYSFVLQANDDGTWTYNFDSGANPLSPGTHIAYAREVVIGGYTSILTQALPFTATACKIADLNCDGWVNLTDFSILMFFWNQTSPSNPRADINNDGLVDMIDFSIMLYYWTG